MLSLEVSRSREHENRQQGLEGLSLEMPLQSWMAGGGEATWKIHGSEEPCSLVLYT